MKQIVRIRVRNSQFIFGYETANLFSGTKQPIDFRLRNSQFVFGYEMVSVTKAPICFRLRNGIGNETANFFRLRNGEVTKRLDP